MGNKKRNSKERRRHSRLTSLIAAMLALVLGLSSVVYADSDLSLNLDTESDPGVETYDAAETTGTWEADASTQNSWYDGKLGVFGQGDNSTQNTGRIWTDKSVYSGDAELTTSGGEPTFTVKNDEGTALVELSALSSAAKISGITTASQPLDIVLVLDASGSMDNEDSYLYTEAYGVQANEGVTYYVRANGRYRQVSYSSQSGWYYGNTYDRTYVTPMTSAEDTNSGHVQFYTRMTKMDALQQAADNFIAQTAAENAEITDQTQRHRIALVKFASTYASNIGNGRDRDGYNYSQIMLDFQYVDATTSQTLQRTVNSLEGEGATRADYGLTHANRLMEGEGSLTGARNYAQRVVIFFTDGHPTNQSEFSDSVAGAAINDAYELKDNGALVFSIGVFEGANPSDTNGDFNRYMNAVSSNYPSAQCYTTGWNGNQQSDNFNDLHLGDRGEEDYYFAADNAESLNSVFETIYDRVTEGTATSPILNTEEIGGKPVGYLTFTDQLGDYVEVKNFKSVIYAGEEFHLAEGDNATSIDENGDTLYHFTGSVAANDIYGESNLSDLIVRVHHEEGQTGDTVTVEIPTSLLPLRMYTAGPNDEGGIDNEVKDAYPIRIFYTVGLKEGLVDENGTLDASQISSDYIASHTDANGNLVFHSNDYAGVENNATTAGGSGTTTATFTPATTNAFYYFTADTPIYNSRSTDDPAGTLRPDSQYWYMRTYYSGGQEQQEWVRFNYDEGSQSTYVNTDTEGNSYIESGAPRYNRANEFVAAKGTNVTDTAANSISPSWGGSGEVVVTLGNNGRIAYSMTGDLRIDKDVTWGDGTANAEKEFTYTVNFNGDDTLSGTFTYTKYTENGTAIDNSGEDLAEGQTTGTLQDGGTVTLADGQYIMVNGLPAGTDFEIVESAESGFTPSVQVGTGEAQQSDTAAGSITSNATTQVTYTNTYEFTGTVTSAAIGGSKVLTGRNWADGESFTFNIEAASPSDAPMPANTSATLTSDGTYAENTAYSFTFGTIEYSKPGTYIYTITEENPDASGMNASAASYTVTVTVEDNGDGTMKTPVIKIEQVADDGGTQLEPAVDVTEGGARFTNEFTGTDEYRVNLEGRKDYTDPTGSTSLANTSFGFTLTALGGKTDASIADYDIPASTVPMPASAQATTNASGEFRFGSMVFGINDVGNTYYYAVTENLPAGVSDQDPDTAGVQYNGMTYDQHTENVSVSVYQDEDGNVIARVTADEDGIAFTNSYAAAPVQNTGDHAMTITKTVDGHSAEEGQFDFTMSAADDTTRSAIAAGQITGEGFAADDPDTADVNEAVTQITQSAGAIEKDGSQDLAFPTLTFTQPGVYTFSVTENNTDNEPAGWTYDEHTYTVTYTVTDTHTGQLQIASQFTGDKTFINTYEAGFSYLEEAGGLVMSKTLNGYAMTAGQFGFTITGADDASTAKLTDADKSFSNPRGAGSGSEVLWRVFRSMTFDQDDAGQTFTFTVHEVIPDTGVPAGYTYDTQDVTVAIQVVDDNNGTMHTVTTVTKGGQSTEYNSEEFVSGTAGTYPTAVFTNSYQASGTALSSVSFDKELNGREWSDTDSFEFTLSADTGQSTVSDEALDASMPETTVYTATSADRDFSFGPFSFTEAGTYIYTVNETQAAEGADTQGVTYDSRTATITVVVGDTGTGTLSIANGYPSVTGLGAADQNNVYSFVNSYTADPAELISGTESGLGVQKVVSGADNSEDFTFTAVFDAEKSTGTAENMEGLNENHALTAEITEDFNAESGYTKSADFGTVSFKAAGTYIFNVTEDNQAASDSHWTYDGSAKQIIVTVTDNGEGELTASVEGNDPIFYNTYYDPADAKSVYDAEDPPTEIDGQMVGVGDILTYTIDWVNNAADENGTPANADITVSDSIPAGTELVENSISEGGVQSGGTITWTFEDQTPGASGTVSFQVRVTEEAAGDTVENHASITIGENDPILTNTVTNLVPGKSVVDAPDAIGEGTILTYQISFSNDADAAVEVMDELTAGQAYQTDSAIVSINGEEQTSEPAVEGTSADGQTLTWNLSELNAGDQVVITFQVTITREAGASVDNTAWVNGHVTNTTTTPYPADDKKTVTDSEGNDLDRGMAGVGDTLTYTIDWANDAVDANGSPAAAEITVTDVVPEGTAYVEGSAENGTYDPETNTIVWDLGEQAAGARGTVSFQVTVTEEAAVTGEITNQAEISVGENDPKTTNKVITTVPGKTETTGSDQIGEGDVLNYQIRFTNSGSAGTAEVVDTLSRGLVYNAESAAITVNGTPQEDAEPAVEGQTLTWNLSGLPANAEVVITFDVTVTREAGASVDNTATVNGHKTNTTTTPYPSDDKKDVFAVGEDGNPTASVNGKLVGVGDELLYTIDWAADEDGSVVITDTLPTGTALVEGSIDNDGSYENGTITWNLGNKNAGDKGTVSFRVTVTEEAVNNDPITNSASIQVGENDPKVVTATTDIPKKEVADTTPETGIQVGDTLTYTIEYRNDTDAAATVTVTDTLPAGLTVDEDSISEGGSYDAETRTITWTFENAAAGAEGTVSFRAKVNENALTGTDPLTNQAVVQVGDNSYHTNTTEGTVSTGDLSVSKTVVGQNGAGVDANKSFAFTISLKDTAGADLTGQYKAQVYSGEEKVGDEFIISGADDTSTADRVENTFTLKHGEKLVITGLPEGAGYVVSEADYTSDGYTATAENQQGTVAKDTETAAVFTNTYNPGEVVIGGDSGQAGITVQKTLSGRSWKENDSFTFTLQAETEGAPMPQGEGADTITIGSPESGAVNRNAFGVITYDRIGTYTYTITEVSGSQGGVTYDGHTAGVTVQVTDENLDGKLEAAVSYNNESAVTEDDQAVTDAAAFTNTYAPGAATLYGSENLTVTKNLNREWIADDPATADVNEKDSFTFTLSTDDEATRQAIEAQTVILPEATSIVVDTDTVNSEGAHQASFGDITFTEAGTYVFTIAEEGESHDGLTYDKEVRHVTVEVTDNTDGTMTARVTGVTPAAGLTFTNVYKPEESTDISGTENLTVTKDLQGREWTAEDRYSFTLTAKDDATAEAVANGTVILPDNADGLEITSETEGHRASFGDITFKEPGTYTFEITEQNTGMAGVTYQQTPVTVTVNVTDNLKGQLVTAVTTSGALTFTNTYKAESGTAVITAEKKMAGREWKDTDIFTFTLTGLDGAPMPATTVVTNDAEGKIAFPAITYSEAGTYEYVITETGGAVPGVTNSTETIHVTVTVTDDPATGKLVTEVSYENGNTITNTYHADPTEVGAVPDFTAKKTVTASENNSYTMKGGEFKFTITPGQDNPAADPVKAQTVSNDADGNVIFAQNVVYTEPGTYTYTVAEESNGVAGITYDASVYTITVEVTDPGNGQLTASCSITKNGQAVNAVTFENTYDPAATSVNLGGSKQLTGKNLEAGEFSFRLEGVNASVPAPTETPEAAPTPEVTETPEAAPVPETTGTPEAEPSEAPEAETETAVPEVTPETDSETAPEAETTETQAGEEVLTKLSGSTAAMLVDETVSSTLVNTLPPMPEETVVTNTAAGTFQFGAIQYTAPGTYTYRITEVNTGEEGITYDGTVYNVTVTVTDENGVLKAETAVTGGSTNEVVFSNSYEAAPVTLTGDTAIRGTKTLEGRTMEEGEFSFQLLNADNEVVSTAVNQADGSFVFGDLTFNEIGTYLYTVKEVSTGLGGVTYDTNTYAVRITVTDAGGHLEAAVEYLSQDEAVDGIVFHNSYKADATSIQLSVTKVLCGRALEAGEFTFQLKDEAGNVVAEAVNDAAGVVRFPEISYEEAGTYHYTVSEVKGNAANVTYDDTVYNMTVTVTDNLKGSLEAQISFEQDGCPVFQNTYTEPEDKPTQTPTKTPTKAPAKGNTVTSVDTGDTADVTSYMAGGIAGAAVLAALIGVTVVRRKRSR